MFRRLLRDYLSLTRNERRGMQVLVLLILVLVIFRSLLPRLLPSREMDMSQYEREFIAFQDSISKLSFYTSSGRYRDYKSADASYTRDAHYPGNVSSAADGSGSADGGSKDGSYNLEPVPFNPNTASLNELLSMGFPEHTARILVNYREAGAEFRKDSDLLRVYGMDHDLFERIKDYIRVDTLDPEELEPATGSRFIYRDRDWDGDRDSLSRYRRFELNQADSFQLLSVYGIGPVFAHRILSYRNSLGGFHSNSQLLEIYGLTPSQQKSLMKCCYIDSAFLRKMDINLVDARELALHPYLDRYQAEAVIYYRHHRGAYEYPGELLINKLLPDSVFRRVQPYLAAGP